MSVLLGIVANRHDDAKGRVHFDLVPIGGDELVDATGNGDHPGPVTGKPTGDPIPLDFGRASDIADGMRVALITAGNSGRVKFIGLKRVAEDWWI